MSQNMLVDRLKAAKRELTALKTAHKRGLGLVKIYKQTYSIPPPAGGAIFQWLTLRYDFSISRYPFYQIYMVWSSFDEFIDAGREEAEYKNNGWTVEHRLRLIKTGTPYQISIYSTSPISSMEYTWG